MENILQNLWFGINSIGAILGLISSLIAILMYLKLRKAKEFIQKSRHWLITINITNPMDNSEHKDYVLEISGKFDFLVSAMDVVQFHNLNLALIENQIELVPIVKPLSDSKYWWIQSSLIVDQDGNFKGSVFLGEKSGAGRGIKFHIVVLAIPKKSVSEGKTMINPPVSYGVSQIITVKRIE